MTFGLINPLRPYDQPFDLHITQQLKNLGLGHFTITLRITLYGVTDW